MYTEYELLIGIGNNFLHWVLKSTIQGASNVDSRGRSSTHVFPGGDSRIFHRSAGLCPDRGDFTEEIAVGRSNWVIGFIRNATGLVG